MLDFHLKHSGMGTILVSQVDQPELYGVVVHDPKTKKISEFREKPKEYVGNHINAGITMLDLRLIKYLELKNLSIGKIFFTKNLASLIQRTCCLSSSLSKKFFILFLSRWIMERFGASTYLYSRFARFYEIHP